MIEIVTISWNGLIASLFNGISTFEGYLMPKLSLSKNSSGTIQPTATDIRESISFPNGICPKVNVIARLEFQLAH